MNSRILACGLPALVLAVVLLAVDASEVLAQGGGVPSLRPYWHVFAAYAAVWIIILGWVVSISRRLARIERTTGDGSSG